MKRCRILYFFYAVWALSSCLKTGNVYTPINATLLSITNDSSGTYDYTYSGNMIGGVSYNGADSTGPAQSILLYLSYGPQSVSVRIFNDTGVDYQYLLTLSKLPLQIWFGSGQGKTEEANFIYLPGTDRLDSVIFGGFGQSSPTYVVYHFTYSGENITGIHENYYTQWSLSYNSDFRISYSGTPNLFRRTDSLMFIYAYPETICDVSQDWVQVIFFAETFSATTFNGLSETGINGFQSTVAYTLNDQGAIAREEFSAPVVDFTAGKRFHYK
jgi:hypothetical protein